MCQPGLLNKKKFWCKGVPHGCKEIGIKKQLIKSSKDELIPMEDDDDDIDEKKDVNQKKNLKRKRTTYTLASIATNPNQEIESNISKKQKLSVSSSTSSNIKFKEKKPNQHNNEATSNRGKLKCRDRDKVKQKYGISIYRLANKELRKLDYTSRSKYIRRQELKKHWKWKFVNDNLKNINCSPHSPDLQKVRRYVEQYLRDLPTLNERALHFLTRWSRLERFRRMKKGFFFFNLYFV